MGTGINQQPLVSIIVPVYNVEKYLTASLESIERQNYENIQLIIVNDGSQDNCKEIIENFIQTTRFKNLIYLEQDNSGLSVARNNALKKVKGKYTYFFDSDDILKKNVIARSVEFMEREKTDLLMFCASFFQDENKKNQATHILCPRKLKNGVVYSMREFIFKMKFERFSPVWLYFYRSEVIKKNHLLFYPNIYFEDALFTPIAYYYMNSIGFLSDIFVYHRMNPNSITMSKDKEQVKVSSYITVLREMDVFIKTTVSDKSLKRYYLKQQILTMREIRNLSLLDKVQIKHLYNNYGLTFDSFYELKFRIKKLIRKI